jgi:hypothetical protein
MSTTTTQNTRENSRVKTSLACTFGPSPATPRNGTVTSLSTSGCFVKTKVWITKGQKMYLRLWLPEERWLRLQGEILYHLEEIGFGILFIDVGAEEESILRDLVGRAATLKAPALVEENQSTE